jgi:hypothetical protein
MVVETEESCRPELSAIESRAVGGLVFSFLLKLQQIADFEDRNGRCNFRNSFIAIGLRNS